jgi:hypothetical protein
MSCLLVSIIFSIPLFCNVNNAASSLLPVSATNSSGLNLIAEIPARPISVFLREILFSES